MVDWADHTDIEQRLRGEVDAARAEYEAVARRAYLPASE